MGVVETRRPQKTASAYFGEARKRGGIQGVREVAHGGGSLDRGKMAGGDGSRLFCFSIPSLGLDGSTPGGLEVVYVARISARRLAGTEGTWKQTWAPRNQS